MLPLKAKHISKFQRSFTLVELLIVIAILAILAAAIVVVINPVEMLASSRDAVRKRDLSNLHRSINLLRVQCPECSLGLSNTIYVSIPDTSSTCANLNLPSLPHPWVYSCVSSLNSRNINGTGWIPINFTLFPGGSPLMSLPIDPVNISASGQFYIYTTVGNTWKITSLLESERHARSMNTDGGPDITLYEVGSDLNIANFQRGLVGSWGFNEGTGTTASDASGMGNTGTLQIGPLGSNTTPAAAWVPGVVGNALSFDGTDDFVSVSDSASLDMTSAITIEGWFRRTLPLTGHEELVRKSNNYMIRVDSNAEGDDYSFFVWIGGVAEPRAGSNIIPTANWDHVVGTYDAVGGSNNVRIYVNGILRGTSTRTGNIDISTMSLAMGIFGGTIDEVRIYNRALSASEIRANFNAGR